MPVFPPTVKPNYRQPSWAVPWEPPKKPNVGDVPANVLYGTYHLAMPYLDPETQKSSASWLATQAPKRFGKYMEHPWRTSPEASQPQAPGESYLTVDRLNKALEALDPRNVFNTITGRQIASPGAEERAYNYFQEQGGGAPLAWLRAYLQTAADAMPDAQGKLKPRSVRFGALSHLQTLEQEVQQNQALLPYLTLAQNLVNPLLQGQAPEGGGVGYTRAAPVPKLEKNPWLT